MARGEQLSRQWKITQSLIAARIGKSAGEIADRLECYPQAVYRDLQALQAAGFPIHTERALQGYQADRRLLHPL
jgi:predicted DNA-binding transcriptional regulator YafY